MLVIPNVITSTDFIGTIVKRESQSAAYRRLLGSPSPSPDRRFLINLTDFDYIMNLKSCHQLGIKPKFIVLIHSAPVNRDRRDNIRETYAQYKEDNRVIFFLGRVSDPSLQKELEVENILYEDTVQGNFVDAYRNLSYKHIMTLKWATEFCPETKFIFKVDDDVFVNTPFVRKFTHQFSHFNNFIMCPRLWTSPPIRDEKSKWYVSEKEFSDEFYPEYCSGWGILLSSDVATILPRVAETTPFFWIDDVYVWGMVRIKTDLKLINTDNLFLNYETVQEMLAGKINMTRALGSLFTSQLPNDQTQRIWSTVKNYTDRGYYKL
ncbi:Hexosyltransferase [Sergentomyia squamirostris]